VTDGRTDVRTDMQTMVQKSRTDRIVPCFSAVASINPKPRMHAIDRPDCDFGSRMSHSVYLLVSPLNSCTWWNSSVHGKLSPITLRRSLATLPHCIVRTSTHRLDTNPTRAATRARIQDSFGSPSTYIRFSMSMAITSYIPITPRGRQRWLLLLLLPPPSRSRH
jgi:hypothetical protein